MLADGAKREHHDDALPHFIVTGFGPFRGVANNPTTTIVEELPSFLISEEARRSVGLRSCTPKELASNVTTHIFETSAEDVRRWQDDWFDRLSQEVERIHPPKTSTCAGNNGGNETGAGTDAAATLCGNRRNVVLIHLGVHYKAECFHLESSAYNEASFRVPDERGFRPRDECVLSTDGGCAARRGEKLSTTLMVPPLVKGMVSRGHPSKLSGDPGRFFVCNYTYCYSLDKCRRFNTTGANEADRPTLYSIFVHVPLFQISGKEEQLKFVVGLMDEISMQLGGELGRSMMLGCFPTILHCHSI